MITRLSGGRWALGLAETQNELTGRGFDSRRLHQPTILAGSAGPQRNPWRTTGLFLSHSYDDLASRTSFFDVSHSLVGRREWKDPIQNWPNDPGIDEPTDLA